MADDAPQPAGCPDGGACHHHCVTGCWRVVTCSPLSSYGEKWTTADRREYGTVVQEWPTTPPVSQAEAAEVHWGGMQGRILAFLHAHVAEHGYPPSIAQIGDAVGLSSTSSVAHQLQVLEHRGHIRREPGVPRAITILTRPDQTPTPTAADLLARIQGPMDSAKALTDRAMGHGKDKDDCTEAEILARGVWHALHYVERYLTGWDQPTDRADWEATTDRFIKMAMERR